MEDGHFNWELALAVIAIFVAVGGVIIAVSLFTLNFCIQQKQDRNEYFNQLEAIKTELISNLITVSNIVGNREEILEGNDIPAFTFNVGVINGILSRGSIQNPELRGKLYTIAQIENLLNRVLDISIATRSASVSAEPASKAKYMETTTSLTKNIVNDAEILNDEIQRVIEAINIGKYDDERQSCYDSFNILSDK